MLEDRVLLVLLPPWGVDTPPLGIASIGRHLSEAGVECDLMDANICAYRETQAAFRHFWEMRWSHLWRDEQAYPEIRRTLDQPIQHVIQCILDSPHRVVGFSLPTNCSDFLFCEIAAALKQRDPARIIVVGGVSATIPAQRSSLCVRAGMCVDYYVLGQGEPVMAPLVKRIFAGDVESVKDMDSVVDSSGDANGKTISMVDDLDALPFPTFEGLDLSVYATQGSLPMEFSRGCIGRCTFCDFRSVSPRYKSKSPDMIVRQIEFYVRCCRTEHLSLCDAAVNGDMAILQSVSEILKERKVPIRISACAIARKEMTIDVLREMRDAGFYRLEYGIESGSPHVLHLMRKPTKPDAMARVLRDTFEVGIQTCVYLMVGYPGETEAGFEATKQFLRDNAKFISLIKSVNPVYIMAGSELHYRAHEMGIAYPDVRTDSHWVLAPDNTPAIRERRVLDLKRLIAALGISATEEAENIEFSYSSLKTRRAGGGGRGSRMPEEGTLYGRDEEKAPAAQCALGDALPKAFGIALVVVPWCDRRDLSTMLRRVRSMDAGDGTSPSIIDLNDVAWQASDGEMRSRWPTRSSAAWTRSYSYACSKEAMEHLQRTCAERILDCGPALTVVTGDGGDLSFLADFSCLLKEQFPHMTCLVDVRGRSLAFTSAVKAARTRFDGLIVDDLPGVLGGLQSAQTKSSGWRRIPGVVEAGILLSEATLTMLQTPSRNLLPCGMAAEITRGEAFVDDSTATIENALGHLRRFAFESAAGAYVPFRARSAQDMLDQIHQTLADHKVSEFLLPEPYCAAHYQRLADFATVVGQSGLEVDWRCDVVLDGHLSRDFLESLRRGRCKTIRFHIGSLIPASAYVLSRAVDTRALRRILLDCSELGIRAELEWILGVPGETENGVLQGLRFIQANRERISAFWRLATCPVPVGSDIHRCASELGLRMSSDSDPLEWVDGCANNSSFRAKRLRQVAAVLKSLAIPYEAFELSSHTQSDTQEKEARRLLTAASGLPDVLLCTVAPWGTENPPVGLAHLSTYLRSRGCSTAVLDLNLRLYQEVGDEWKLLWHVENKNFWSNPDTFRLLRDEFSAILDRHVDDILSSGALILGFSVVDPKERLTIEIIQRIREKDRGTPIVLGGPACFTPEYRRLLEDALADQVDAYVVGEGEEALAALLTAFRSGHHSSSIPGVLVPGVPTASPVRPHWSRDLRQYPLPTFEEFDLKEYRAEELIVQWSRGCIGRCAFCKGWELEGPYRRWAPDRIADALTHYVKNMGIRRFTICDSLLNGDVPALQTLCELIVEKDLGIQWRGQAMPRAELTAEVLNLMQQSGCTEIQFGLETASPKVLALMGKGNFFTPEDVSKLITAAHDAGIRVSLFLIVGYPGETEDDFKATLAFLKVHADAIDQVKSINSLHIITGTRLHRKAMEQGIRLPPADYHYLWETDDSTIDTRAARTRRTLDLCKELGIEVLETNLTEGKQNDVLSEVAEPCQDRSARMAALRASVNRLRSMGTAEPTVHEHEGDAGGCQADLLRGLPRGFADEDDMDVAGVLQGWRAFKGPNTLEIDLTNRCNLNCIGCWCHSPLIKSTAMSAAEKRLFLPTEVVLRIVDEAASMGLQFVQISGAGEPFLHPDIVPILRHIKSRGIACRVITNGTCLDDATCDVIADIGLDELSVSLWAGTAETYKALHPGSSGDLFPRISRALRRIGDAKKLHSTESPEIRIYNVLCNRNHHEIEEMVDFALSVDADAVEFTVMDTVPGETDHLAITEAHGRDILKQLARLHPRLLFSGWKQTRTGRFVPTTHAGELSVFGFLDRAVDGDGYKFRADSGLALDSGEITHAYAMRGGWNQIRIYRSTEPARLSRPTGVPPDGATDKVGLLLAIVGVGTLLRRVTSHEDHAGLPDVGGGLRCYVGWLFSRIRANGDVIPCCKACQVPVGNIYRESFSDIWHGEKMTEFRNRALYLPKSHPYFAPIACQKGCDNAGMNVATFKRISALSPRQRVALVERAVMLSGGPS